MQTDQGQTLNDKNIASIKARYVLMVETLNRPKHAMPAVIAACQTQYLFASWNMPEKGIFPMALNTLIGNAELAIETGGWTELKILMKRIQFLAKEQAKKSRPNRRNAQAEKIAEYKMIEENAIRVRAVLSSAYYDLKKLTHRAAKNDDVLAEQLRRHEAKFGLELGYRIVEKG